MPPLSPAQKFAAIILWLGRAVVARGGGDRLSAPLIALVIDRIREINQRVARLAARVAGGRYTPRRSAARRPATIRRPRRPGALPRHFGWLLPLVPEAVGYRSQLDHLLRDPEMLALIEAAPTAMRRPLRSLCWMLRLRPPPVLAPPALAPPAARLAAKRALPPPPPPRARTVPAPVPPPPARASGPPRKP